MCNRRKLARRTAFTLIELMIVVAIIASLIAILLLSLNRARQQAYPVKCAAGFKNADVAGIHGDNLRRATSEAPGWSQCQLL